MSDAQGKPAIRVKGLPDIDLNLVPGHLRQQWEIAVRALEIGKAADREVIKAHIAKIEREIVAVMAPHLLFKFAPRMTAGAGLWNAMRK